MADEIKNGIAKITNMEDICINCENKISIGWELKVRNNRYETEKVSTILIGINWFVKYGTEIEKWGYWNWISDIGNQAFKQKTAEENCYKKSIKWIYCSDAK